MALTIATGFVVDDAIVMIENISRYIEEGETPLAGGAEGRGADRLHHHLADRVADRGADPAAVHGRRGRPAVPRIRHHAGGDHRDLGGGVADAGADDVRQAGAAPAGRASAAASTCAARARRSTGSSAATTAALNWVLDHQPLTLLVAVVTLVLTVAALCRRCRRASSRCRTPALIQGISVAAQTVSYRRDGAAAAGAGRGDPEGPRRRQPDVRSSASTAPT